MKLLFVILVIGFLYWWHCEIKKKEEVIKKELEEDFEEFKEDENGKYSKLPSNKSGEG